MATAAMRARGPLNTLETMPPTPVATMNSTPEDRRSISPRSRERRKSGRSLNGTAHTRSKAF